MTQDETRDDTRPRDRMKKVMLISHYWEPIKGGITTHTTNLFREIENNTDASVIKVIAEGEPDAYNVKKLHSKRKTAITLELLSLLMKEKPQIISNNGPWYFGLACVLYKMMRRDVAIFQTHHTDPQRLLTGIRKSVYESILSRFDVNIFVSKYLRSRYSYYDIRAPREVIYGGIRKNITPAKSAVDEFMRKFGLEGSHHHIGYISNFSWKKKSDGAMLLARSFSLVIPYHRDARLLIAGDGEFRKDIVEAVKSLGIERYVTFVGMVEDPSVVFEVSQIVAHISFQESLGLVILEAMSSKRPVIASRVGGIPELIDDARTGILVDNDQKEIAMAIVSLLEDKRLRDRLAKNGHDDALKNFSWKKEALEYIELFNKHMPHG